jgi:hypothetical protein
MLVDNAIRLAIQTQPGNPLNGNHPVFRIPAAIPLTVKSVA